MSERTERERFHAHGWDLDSIEAACEELDRLAGLAREYAATVAFRDIEIAQLEAASGLKLE